MKSPAFAPIGASLQTILAKRAHASYFRPSTIPPAFFGKAPVIELATFSKTESQFPSNIQGFIDGAFGGEAEGYYGAAYGELPSEKVYVKLQKITCPAGPGRFYALSAGCAAVGDRVVA